MVRNLPLARRQIALLTLASEVNSMHVQTHVFICTAPKCFIAVFKNNTAPRFVSTTMVHGQPADLCKELSLYVGAYWLTSSVSQMVARSLYPISVNTLVTHLKT